MTRRRKFPHRVYKICAFCGEQFTRPEKKYSDSMWASRRFCSHRCAGRGKPKWHVSIRDKFFFHVFPEPMSGCWLWDGPQTSRGGYGQFAFGDRRNIKAHRYSYELHKGPIPDSLFVCHKCDTPACVNPDHLYVGTAADNAADAVSRNRSCRGQKNTHAILTEIQVRQIRRSTASVAVLVSRYGIAESTVRAVLKRHSWGWLQ